MTSRRPRARFWAWAFLSGAALAVASAQLAPVAAAAAPAEPSAGTTEAPPYINGFCLGVVAGASGVLALRERMQTFGARPAPSGDGDAAKPDGLDMAGQLFRFALAGSPDAFVDQRRSVCALVYSGKVLPPAAMDEIGTAKLPVGPDGESVGWRLVTQTFAGRPHPPKFFLQLGEPGGYGVCAEINNDLRRRDQSPAAVVQLYNCRLGKDERLG